MPNYVYAFYEVGDEDYKSDDNGNILVFNTFIQCMQYLRDNNYIEGNCCIDKIDTVTGNSTCVKVVEEWF